MTYRPLNMFIRQTDELKKIISEYPDYPIIVMVGSDVVADDYYGWWYAPCLSFSVGEILDCEQDINFDKVYTDKDEFKEDIIDRLSYDYDSKDLSDEEFDKIVKEKYQKYESYWKKVIEIRADV